MPVSQSQVVTVAARAEQNGVEDIVNVFDLQKTDAGTIDNTATLSDVEDWIEGLYLILRVLQLATTVYREIKVYNRSLGTVIGTVSITNPSAGSASGSDLPPGAAGLISFPTEVGKVIGRKYIGGLSTGLLDTDGTMLSFAVTNLVNAGNYMRASYVGTNGSWQYGVWDKNSAILRVPIATIVTDVFAYQRRRKTGRGS